MAKTISQLPDATAVNGSDELIIQQSGVTKRATKTEVLAGIVNANVDAAAAIAGTKIAPDFGSQGVQTTSSIAAGAASRAVGGNTAQLQSHGTTGSRLAATRWTADTNGPILTLAKSRGAAVGTRGVVQSGDTLTSMQFFGDDGTSDVIAAGITVQVEGTPGPNDMPGRLVFSTTADGASTATERMRINSSGNVGIGTSSPLSTNGGLDIASGGLGLVIGAESGSSARTNATAKLGRIVVPHYTNAEEPLAGLIASSESSASFIGIGGGSSTANAATAITFYTASNNTTTTGTARAIINSSGNVGIGTTSPNAAALVDVTSTTQGFLPPRMTTAQRDAVSTPPDGLMIYNTTTNKLNVRANGSWEAVTSS